MKTQETLILATDQKNGEINVQLCGTQADLMITFGAIVLALLKAECSERRIVGIFENALELHKEKS